MATYRLRIDLTYSTNNNATTAHTNINNTLAAEGRAEQATRDLRVVSLMIEGLTEAEAQSLTDALTPAWGSTTRSGGKVSTVRTGE